jgi:hypothetical protein
MKALSIFGIVAYFLGCLSVHAKDFGKLPTGRIISCAEAAAYRDNILLKEYDALSARYADGTADRQKLVMDKLNRQLQQLDEKWAKTAPELKKRVAAQWVALTLSVVGTATGEWAAARVTADNRVAVKILADRAAFASSSINSAVMTGKIGVSDVALLPISAIVSVTFPPASLSITVLSLGLGAIDQYENLADLDLERSEYSASAEILKTALRNLAAKSVASQLQKVNQVKNEIDRACG